MKKQILFLVAAAISQGTFAQLTQANEPAIGTVQTMFLCDSNTVQYDAVVGNTAIWDFTGLEMYGGETRDISILDATTAPNAPDFISSTKVFAIENLLATYYTSTALERTVQGIVLTDPTAGAIIGKWSTNEEIVMTYPFAYSNTSTDTYAGSVIAAGQGPFPATGTINSTIDAIGTLNLPFAVSVANVTRYKTVDNGAIASPFGTINLTRTQYEYYDLATSNLPIFLIAKITIVGSPLFPTPTTQNLILSKFPGGTIGLSEKEAVKFSVFPNPANDIVTIKGEFQKANVSIVNTVGQVVINQEITSGAQINVASLDAGMYLVKVEKDGLTTVKNLSIR